MGTQSKLPPNQSPQERAVILRALRNYRGAMIDLSRRVRGGGVIDSAAKRAVDVIDAIAKILTGDARYFDCRNNYKLEEDIKNQDEKS